MLCGILVTDYSEDGFEKAACSRSMDVCPNMTTTHDLAQYAKNNGPKLNPLWPVRGGINSGLK